MVRHTQFKICRPWADAQHRALALFVPRFDGPTLAIADHRRASPMSRPRRASLALGALALALALAASPTAAQGAPPLGFRAGPRPRRSRRFFADATPVVPPPHAASPSSAAPPPAACNGHGTPDPTTGSCACDTPFPAPGSSGWTGAACDVPVLGLATQTVASHATQSGDLAGGEWRCYAAPVPTTSEWTHLAVELKHTQPLGDPDVYGLFTNATRPRTPSGSTQGFDFREISSSTYVTSVVVAERAAIPAAREGATGVYLCVTAYGDHAASYELTAAFSRCPATFAGSSEVIVCGAAEGEADPAGACVESSGACACNAYEDHTFVAPDGAVDADVAEEEPYGFESCAARIDFFPAGAKTHRWVDQTLPVDGWRFYRLDVDATDYQMVVSLEKPPLALGGYANLYLRHETLPEHRWGRYDYPTEYFSGADENQEVVMTRGDGRWVPGAWYAGVYSGGGDAATFELSATKFDCPRNCSDRGTCDATSESGPRTCVCDTSPVSGYKYLGDDCSEEYGAWTKSASGGFEINGTLDSAAYDFFALPEVDARETRRQIELKLTARYSRSGDHAEEWYWETSRPTLLLKNGDSRDDFPTLDNYTFKVTLERQGEPYAIDLCASQFRAGVWNAAVHNPERQSAMSYGVAFEKRGICPSANDAECSGHGSCRASDASDPNFATCACDEGWTASDCAFKTCPDDTFVASPMPGGAPGETCLRACVDGKRRTDGCDVVRCAPPARATGGVPGAAKPARCVRDECDRDAFVLADDASGETCVKRCAPEPGDDPDGARKMSAECDPATIRGGRGGGGGSGAAWWGVGVAAVGVVAVAGAACVARAGNDGGIRGDRLIERVKAFFGGAEQRYDPYFDDADDDSFAQADFSRG